MVTAVWYDRLLDCCRSSASWQRRGAAQVNSHGREPVESKTTPHREPRRGDGQPEVGYGPLVCRGAFTVSQSNLDQVRAYIENQETHHARVTFQEEFISFLKRHNLPYDERYVWW